MASSASAAKLPKDGKTRRVSGSFKMARSYSSAVRRMMNRLKAPKSMARMKLSRVRSMSSIARIPLNQSVQSV